MKPTIGRIVQYTTQGPQVDDAIPPMVSHAAMVIRVLDEDHADLQVFLQSGVIVPVLNIQRADVPTVRHWHWPPRE